MIRRFRDPISLLFPFSLVFLLTICSPAFCQSNYSRYDTFWSLNFSYSELAGIIKDAEDMLRSVNGKPDTPTDITKKIQIEKDGMKITFSDPDEMKNYERKPEVAYELFYFYYYPRGKISQINLNFTDTTRKISIEGTDPNQIDGLFSMLKEKIENRSSFFGGALFRYFLFLGIFISLLIYSALGAEISKKTGWTSFIFTICVLTVSLLRQW